MKKLQIFLSAFMLVLALSEIALGADKQPQWTIQNKTQKYIDYHLSTSSVFISIQPNRISPRLVLTDNSLLTNKQPVQIIFRYKDKADDRQANNACGVTIYPNDSLNPMVVNGNMDCQVKSEDNGDYYLTISDSKSD